MKRKLLAGAILVICLLMTLPATVYGREDPEPIFPGIELPRDPEPDDPIISLP